MFHLALMNVPSMLESGIVLATADARWERAEASRLSHF